MRILVTAATGQLGPYLVRELEQRGERVVAWHGRPQIDLADADALRRAFAEARPDVVIHTAALSKPAACYHEPDLAEQINVRATQQLTELAAERDARMIFTSTDMVFDGEQGGYRESDPPNPPTVYGRTKLAAERVVRSYDRGLVARLSLLFGPGLGSSPTLFDQWINGMREGEPLKLFHDEYRTPLALPLAAQALADAAASAATGLFHLGGPQRVSRLDFARIIANAIHADSVSLTPISRLSIASDEPRPYDTSLHSDRWREEFTTPIDQPLDEVVRTMVR